MLKYLIPFFFAIGYLPCAAEDLPEAEPAREIRIIELLPYMVNPPLVNPLLPDYFILGTREDDPYFSKGYVWGHASNTEEYFAEDDSLSDCVIRAQVSPNVFQIGVDRLSFDDSPNTIVATGLIEYTINKGKWGIFPYREIKAKGPKGRKVYQLWVGLNVEGGATLDFQFIYPSFLNEPTQNQKKVWQDFVKKTTLLNLEELMLAKDAKARQVISDMEKDQSHIHLMAYKRKRDQKLLVVLESLGIPSKKPKLLSIEDAKIPYSGIALKTPSAKVTLLKGLEESEVESFEVFYQIVDEFPFRREFLDSSRFQKIGPHLIFE